MEEHNSKSWAEAVFEVVSSCFDRDLLPKKRRDPEKIIAYHEAGHAVLDLYHGIPPEGATIIPNEQENTAGYVLKGWVKYGDLEGYYIETLETWEEVDKFDPLLVLLSEAISGMLSSFIYTGKLNIEGLGCDLDFCGDVILSYGIHTLTDEMINTAANYTLTILMKNWDHVEKIAEDLIIHKTLDERYFQNLYKSTAFIRIDPVILLGNQ